VNSGAWQQVSSERFLHAPPRSTQLTGAESAWKSNAESIRFDGAASH